MTDKTSVETAIGGPERMSYGATYRPFVLSAAVDTIVQLGGPFVEELCAGVSLSQQSLSDFYVR